MKLSRMTKSARAERRNTIMQKRTALIEQHTERVLEGGQGPFDATGKVYPRQSKRQAARYSA